MTEFGRDPPGVDDGEAFRPFVDAAAGAGGARRGAAAGGGGGGAAGVSINFRLEFVSHAHLIKGETGSK